VIVLFCRRVFTVVHQGANGDNLNAFKKHIKILFLLASMVDAIPFYLG